ncbi:hypothetical protein [Cysteiniphilum marinum]|nr:hypothetical protein [Cysteiniphilum marinum]
MALHSLIPIVIIVLAIVFVFASVKVVPQASEFVVERFGRYYKTLHP